MSTEFAAGAEWPDGPDLEALRAQARQWRRAGRQLRQALRADRSERGHPGRDAGHHGRDAGHHGRGRYRHGGQNPFGLLDKLGPPRPRVGRGDIRLAVLGLLEEAPMHGYQLIQEITERSNGQWRASPGSVYPTLSQLEDEELLEPEQNAGRRVMRLTETGRSYVAAHRAEIDAVWDAFAHEGDEQDIDIRHVMGATVQALMQVLGQGNARQRDQARRVLERARRDFYRILAEIDPEDDEQP